MHATVQSGTYGDAPTLLRAPVARNSNKYSGKNPCSRERERVLSKFRDWVREKENEEEEDSR